MSGLFISNLIISISELSSNPHRHLRRRHHLNRRAFVVAAVVVVATAAVGAVAVVVAPLAAAAAELVYDLEGESESRYLVEHFCTSIYIRSFPKTFQNEIKKYRLQGFA